MNQVDPAIIQSTDPTECPCGNNVFIQLFQIKYISPIFGGQNPGGSTASVFIGWKCTAPGCGVIYPNAMDKKAMKRYYDHFNDELAKRTAPTPAVQH